MSAPLVPNNIPTKHWNTPSLSATPVKVFVGQQGVVRILQNWGTKDIVVGGSDVSVSGGNPVKGFIVKGNQTVPQNFTDNLSAAEWYAVTLDGSSYSGATICEIY